MRTRGGGSGWWQERGDKAGNEGGKRGGEVDVNRLQNISSMDVMKRIV
jgi:hypothetical protein